MNHPSSSFCGPVGCSFASERINLLESRMRLYAQIKRATLASTAADYEPRIVKEDIAVLSQRMAGAEAKLSALRSCIKTH
jgi:hypothetical protein